MKEYMLLIRNRIRHDADWSQEKREQFLKKCEYYIGELRKNGKFISAQPLVREGVIISGTAGSWHDKPISETEEIQVGYYHINAENMDEAIEIAKQNPEFEYSPTARVEVRPVKVRENATGFVYPKKT
jgi:hypothetical protein